MIWWKWRTTRANNQTKVSLIRAFWIIHRQTKQSSYSRSSKSLTNQEEIKTFRYYALPFRLLRSWRTLFMLAATISRTGSLSSRVGLACRSWCSGEYPVYDDCLVCLRIIQKARIKLTLVWLFALVVLHFHHIMDDYSGIIHIRCWRLDRSFMSIRCRWVYHKIFW